MKKLLLFIALTLISATGGVSIFSRSVSAQIDINDENQSLICAEEKNKESTLCKELEAGKNGDPIVGDPTTGENGIVGDIINAIALITSVIAIIIIIIAGLTFVTSNGDAGKVKSSRDAIIYAIVGLVVIALSRYIIIFVINNV